MDPATSAGSRHVSGNRGVALLMALAVMAVLVPAALELNRRVRETVRTAAALGEGLQLEQMALSGVHLAMALLAEDRARSETDSLHEDWADPEKMTELLAAAPFDRGRVRVEIADERGRLQVNALAVFPGGTDANDAQMFFWDRFLAGLIEGQEIFEEIEVPTVVSSLKDWIDGGDDEAVTGLQGAESDYYLSLDTPYEARNAPMTHLSDLLRVRGVTPELYHDSGGSPGLASHVTVYGQTAAEGGGGTWNGRINLGTAPLPVLRALLPAEFEGFVQSLHDYRQAEEDGVFVNDVSGRRWYRQVPGYGEIGAERRKRFEALVTTGSDDYRIVSRAGADGRGLTITAFVRRERDRETGRWHCRLLGRQSEETPPVTEGEDGAQGPGN